MLIYNKRNHEIFQFVQCEPFQSKMSQNTPLNHSCDVALSNSVSFNCVFRLSASRNHARTAGRTLKTAKTGMLIRTCRYASMVSELRLYRSSSLSKLYALTCSSTNCCLNTTPFCVHKLRHGFQTSK